MPLAHLRSYLPQFDCVSANVTCTTRRTSRFISPCSAAPPLFQDLQPCPSLSPSPNFISNSTSASSLSPPWSRRQLPFSPPLTRGPLPFLAFYLRPADSLFFFPFPNARWQKLIFASTCPQLPAASLTRMRHQKGLNPNASSLVLVRGCAWVCTVAVCLHNVWSAAPRVRIKQAFQDR